MAPGLWGGLDTPRSLLRHLDQTSDMFVGPSATRKSKAPCSKLRKNFKTKTGEQ